MSKELDKAVAYNPFDYVESCEPDCTLERHAYHQGQWDMAVRICRAFGVLPNPVDGDDIPTKAKQTILTHLLEHRPEDIVSISDEGMAQQIIQQAWIDFLKGALG